MKTETARERFAKALLGTERDGSQREAVVRRVESGAPREQRGAEQRRAYPRDACRPGERCTPSVCFSCHSTCEVLVYTDAASGKVLRVEGDPNSPQTHGRLCAKGLASADLCHNPKRLTAPLRRIGERGEGRFEEIGWEEALDITAGKLREYRERLGPQSVALLEGTRRGWSRVYSRFANAFGTPNHGAAGWAQCLWPRLIDCNLTYGKGAQYSETQDYPNADCILCWGINPPTCWGVRAGDIMDARQRGAALIVVDPYLSETAAKADIWLQLRPDTDMALALGLLHVIIQEQLWDEAFTAEWTSGFPELREAVAEYPPAWAAGITGVPEELIRRAARLYAKASSASLVRSLAVDQLHDSVQVCRALSALIAITGNIGKPGSNNVVSLRGERSQNTHDFILADLVPPEVQRLRCGYHDFPLLTQEHAPVPTAHMPTLWEQIITGDPYPIPCAMIFGSNAMVSYTNAGRVKEALAGLEFLAVCDLFMTPTARMADIVLPASSWLERCNVISSFQTDNTHTLFQQPAVPPVGQSRNDVDIIIGLAKRLGLEQYFWKDAEGLYDYLLEPAGLTYREGAARRRLHAPMVYGAYREKGFATPTGRIELFSCLAREKGCDPLPRYTPSFQSLGDTPELAREYPLLMTTGRHESAYRISENRENPHLRELVPRAFLDIHPDTAAGLGIREGQRVMVESTAGRAYAYARFTAGLRRDVVQGISGWWGQYNINRTVPWGRYARGVGTVCARGYLCRVTPAEEPDEAPEDRQSGVAKGR